jgi:hypothetical protein
VGFVLGQLLQVGCVDAAVYNMFFLLGVNKTGFRSFPGLGRVWPYLKKRTLLEEGGFLKNTVFGCS